MFSLETETLLTELFLIIQDGEQSVESSRQILSENTSFDPYLAFRFIDKEDKRYLDEYNFVNLMK